MVLGVKGQEAGQHPEGQQEQDTESSHQLQTGLTERPGNRMRLYNLQTHLKYVLPPAKPHLLNLPQTPLPTGEQMLKLQSPWGEGAFLFTSSKRKHCFC